MSEVNSMEKMTQTCRTILFEEFNSDVDSLDILLENRDFNTDDFEETLKEKLEVHSFKEFLKKFPPQVYEIYMGDADGKNPSIEYTTDREKANMYNGVPRIITEDVYYDALSQLYSEKGTSGESNLTFKDEIILDMLSPKYVIEKSKTLARKLNDSVREYQKLSSKGENANVYAQKIVECRKDIIKNTNNFMMLLPAAISNCEKKIECLDMVSSKKEETKSIGNRVAGYLIFNSESDISVKTKELTIKESTQNENNNNTVTAITAADNSDNAETEANEAIIKVVESDLDKHCKVNEFTKSIVLNTYAPLTKVDVTKIKEDKIELEKQKAYLEGVYARAKQSFVDEMTKILQRLLGVKIFFDHATVNGGSEGCLPENAGLIITNCKASKLVEGDLKDKFKDFIIQRGVTEVENKIWFGILPNVSEDNTTIKEAEANIENPLSVDLDFSSDSSKTEFSLANEKIVSFSSAKSILTILNDARVMTIFNFLSDNNHQKNTFNGLDAGYIENIKRKLNPIRFKHAVFTYPNFTITRYRKIKIGENADITIPGVYIDAAYVAAGLLVGSQQIDYLKKHGFGDSVDKESVCVHVDLEGDAERENIITKFNREVGLRWSRDLKEKITEDKFGFAFCSDGVYSNGKKLQNTYVYFARTLDNKNIKFYRPIYQVLMEDFINQYLRTETHLDIERQRAFAQNECHKWWNEAQINQGKKYIPNLLLQYGEEITFDNEAEAFHAKFRKDNNIVNEIKVEIE